MDIILTLLLLISLVTSTIYFLIFIIKIIRKKPAKIKLYISLCSFIVALFCVIGIGIIVPDTQTEDTKKNVENVIESTSEEPEVTTEEVDEQKINDNQISDKSLKQEKTDIKREKEKDIFNKGVKLFNEKNYKKSIKQFRKIPADSPFYKMSNMYLMISNNEQNLKICEIKFIKTEKANIREMPSKDSPISFVLFKNTEIYECYGYNNWTRIYKEGKDRLIFADDPEINGWIHNSLLEDKKSHEKRIENENKIEEQRQQEERSKAIESFTQWSIQYLAKAPELIQDIEPMWVEQNMVGIKLNVSSRNKIVIENISIKTAYDLRSFYGPDVRIYVNVYVGYSEVADIRWSISDQRFECNFK